MVSTIDLRKTSVVPKGFILYTFLQSLLMSGSQPHREAGISYTIVSGLASTFPFASRT